MKDVEDEVSKGFNQPINTDLKEYIGNSKGIQGHQNSCYLDATLFALFALSHDFDDMFLCGAKDKLNEVSQILWINIVNPLRK